MRTALVDHTGRILRKRKTTTAISEGPDRTSERLIAECRSLIDEARLMGGEIQAIGLGVAGKINRSQGLVVFSPNLPSMRNYPLAGKLEEGVGIPVVIENDANVFGVGEHIAGTARGIENWIGITLGTGVGGCLILRNEIWIGDDLGFVGEIGHTIVQPEGRLCLCGSSGCLEAYASGWALVAGVKEAAASGDLSSGPLYDLWESGKLTAEGVYRCAKENDSEALQLFHRMGWALGLAIANQFTVLGIRHAILGGGVSAGWDCFIHPLKESLARHSSMLSADDMVVLKSTLGDEAALIGAAFLAINRE
jgi:glucokinase